MGIPAENFSPEIHVIKTLSEKSQAFRIFCEIIQSYLYKDYFFDLIAFLMIVC